MWLQQRAPEAAPPFDARVEEREGAVTVRVGDEEVALEVTAGTAGRGWCRWRGRLLPYVVAQRGQEIHVWLAGHQFVFARAGGPGRRASGAATVGDVVAPMPGRVLRVLVRPGQRVEAGQPLVVVESMKMEQTLTAPGAGVVRRVLAQEGVLVEGGAALVELGPASQPSA